MKGRAVRSIVVAMSRAPPFALLVSTQRSRFVGADMRLEDVGDVLTLCEGYICCKVVTALVADNGHAHMVFVISSGVCAKEQHVTRSSVSATRPCM